MTVAKYHDGTAWRNVVSQPQVTEFEDGTTVQWVAVALDEAPVDGVKYVRQNAGWVPA